MKYIKTFENREEEWKLSHNLWKDTKKELDRLVDEKAIEYKGDYLLNRIKPDRFLSVDKTIPGISPSYSNKTYTYLHGFYTKENIQNTDEVTNDPIDGTYDVYCPLIYLDKDHYDKYHDSINNDYIKYTENGINKSYKVKISESYIFHGTEGMQQLIDVIK